MKYEFNPITGKLDATENGDGKEVLISGTTTASCGGIGSNVQIKDKTVVELIKDILFPFVAPTLTFTTDKDLYQRKGTSVAVVLYRCVHWKSAKVTKVELYKNDAVVETFTGTQISDGQSYSYNATITDTTTFVLKVYYTDDKGASKTMTSNAITYTFRYPLYAFILPTSTNVATDLYNVVEGGEKKKVTIGEKEYYVADFGAAPYLARKKDFTPSSTNGQQTVDMFNGALSEEYIAAASSGRVSDIVLNESNSINMTSVEVAVLHNGQYIPYKVGYINDKVSRLATDKKYSPCYIAYNGQV